MWKNLKETILNKIEIDNIKPISKKYFLWKNRSIWLIFFVTIIIIWIALSFFVDDFLEIKDFLSFKWDYDLIIPNMFWLIIISLLIILWIKEIRKTKYWYKFKSIIILLLILLSSLSATLLVIDTPFTKYIHKNIIEYFPWIKKYIYNESLWNNPENWRLIWKIYEVKNDELIINDLDWKKWKIITKNSHIWKYIILKQNIRIRIIWKVSSDLTFDAKKIMPYFWEWKTNK